MVKVVNTLSLASLSTILLNSVYIVLRNMKTTTYLNVCGGDTKMPREAIGHWVSPQITPHLTA